MNNKSKRRRFQPPLISKPKEEEEEEILRTQNKINHPVTEESTPEFNSVVVTEGRRIRDSTISFSKMKSSEINIKADELNSGNVHSSYRSTGRDDDFDDNSFVENTPLKSMGDSDFMPFDPELSPVTPDRTPIVSEHITTVKQTSVKKKIGIKKSAYTSKSRKIRRNQSMDADSFSVSRTKKGLKGVKKLVALTAFEDKSERSQLEDVVQNLKGFKLISETHQMTTHLIQGSDLRTVKTMYALARGSWILDKEFLYDTMAKVASDKNQRVSEEEHEVDFFKKRVERFENYLLFEGMRFNLNFYDEQGALDYDALSDLIKICKGRVSLNENPGKSDVVLVNPKEFNDDRIDLDEAKDESFVSYRWVLDSIEQSEVLKMDDYYY